MCTKENDAHKLGSLKLESCLRFDFKDIKEDKKQPHAYSCPVSKEISEYLGLMAD